MENSAQTKQKNIKLANLKPYENNARVHPREQIDTLKKSILEFGFTIPILVDEDNVIRAGHGRYLAVSELVSEGHEQFSNIPCVVAINWPEDKLKAYVIADNKIAEGGDWDKSVLDKEIASLLSFSFDLTTIGYSTADIDAMTQAAAGYTPVLNPITAESQITADDVTKRQNELETKYDAKPQDLVTVICPHCMEEFKVNTLE